jgi:hypothetical protein
VLYCAEHQQPRADQDLAAGTRLAAPADSQLVMVGEMPYLGAQATAADITACLEARDAKRARTKEVQINRVSVQLVDLYNAVAAQGGAAQVSMDRCAGSL